MNEALKKTKMFEWIRDMVLESLTVDAVHWAIFIEEASSISLYSFLTDPQVSYIYFWFERMEQFAGEEHMQESGLRASIKNIKLRGKVVYFNKLQLQQPLDLNRVNQGIVCFGEINSKPLQVLSAMFDLMVGPVQINEKDLHRRLSKQDLQSVRKDIQNFRFQLNEVVKNMRPQNFIFNINQDLAALQEAERLQNQEILFDRWLKQLDQLISKDLQPIKELEEAGPKSQIEFWKSRLRELSSWSQQMKSRNFVQVRNDLLKHKNSQLKRQSRQSLSRLFQLNQKIERNLTDRIREANDNLQYLNILDKYIEPIYSASIPQIIASLPALMNTIKMIHTIARFYNTSDKITGLFIKITNEMIKKCKETIMADNDLWTRPPLEVIHVCHSCIQLSSKYRQTYKATKKNSEKSFDFSENQIFSKFQSFVKRLYKVIQIFSQIHHYDLLESQKLQGVDEIIARFRSVVSDFKRKRANDLLDFSKQFFDKEFSKLQLEFQKIQSRMETVINSNFNKERIIQLSLNHLNRFQQSLHKGNQLDNLKERYFLVIHNYVAEIQALQKIYDQHRKNKTTPPIIRNVTPCVGKIIWANHMLRRITAPIQLLPKDNPALPASELKFFYKAYNRLGKQLQIYITWHYEKVWLLDFQRAKHALDSSILVRSDKLSKNLMVNMDFQIFQIFREGKLLLRNGIDIPDSCKHIIKRELDYKLYHDELQAIIRHYQKILSQIKPICRSFLLPQVFDLELSFLPGITKLSWNSINIDLFIKDLKRALHRLEQLVLKINDIIENRIQLIIYSISMQTLIKFSQGESTYTLQQFLLVQEEFIRSQTKAIQSKSTTIQKSVQDLIKVALSYPLDPKIDPVQPEQSSKIIKYYFWCFYEAYLNTTQKSLHILKDRVCGSTGLQQLDALFEVNVKILKSQVHLVPSLNDIQKTINRTAAAVIQSSKHMGNWCFNSGEHRLLSLYELISQDRQTIKVILLLAGSIQGTKSRVLEFMGKFCKFEWLWKHSISQTLKQFYKYKTPKLSEYEQKLKLFIQAEVQIQKIEQVSTIGAMMLKTQHLVQGLRQHVKEWKNRFCQDLHIKAQQQLQRLTELIKEYTEKITKIEVKDIDSLGMLMNKLQEIRELQSVIDIYFQPVVEMYNLLEGHVNLTDKDEMDARSMLKTNWKTLVVKAEQIGKNLSFKQVLYLKTLKQNIKLFQKQVKDFRRDFQLNGPTVKGITPKQVIERLKRYDQQFNVRLQQFKIYRNGQNLFSLQNQEYPELAKTNVQINNLKKLCSLYTEVQETITLFQENLFEEITAESVQEMNYKIASFNDQSLQIPKDLRSWVIFKALRNQIDAFAKLLPLCLSLRKGCIEPRHWQQLNLRCQVQIPYRNLAEFTVQHLMKSKIFELADEIEQIVQSAQKQCKIKKNFQEIQNHWRFKEFTFGNWGKREKCVLEVKSVQELIQNLQEDQITLSTMNAQRFSDFMKTVIESEIRKFSDAFQTLEKWIKVQKLWTSLQPVFTGYDISKQMPNQAKLFASIDKTWIKCMQKANDTKKFLECCQLDFLRQNLPDMQKKLQECQKMLQAYLQGKRKIFPRFYFVSNPTLLKILSQGTDISAIQEDFQKLFDSVSRVQFIRNDKRYEKIIKSLIHDVGQQQQSLQLVTPVRCDGNIQIWLKQLQKEMRLAVRQEVRRAADTIYDVALSFQFKNQNFSLDAGNRVLSFVKQSKAQVALLGIQLLWTIKMTESIQAKVQRSKTQSAKKGIVQYMMRTLTEHCLQLTSQKQRIKFQALITIHVNQKDVTDTLKQINSGNEFEWLKQVRVYWNSSTQHCYVHITDCQNQYLYQYLGVKQRLCVTNLTVKCYITLIQALAMYYGGAPVGPAGTGKTQTVKDLCRSLGNCVVVTNCSDQHRYKDIAKIFKGLIQSGLWGCLDQFNRIKLQVLSVVTMQIEAIVTARKQHAKQVVFPEESQPLTLVPSLGYFITMNPKYLGRQQLPQNMKSFFRNVSMMVPNKQAIIKVKLAAVGFQNIAVLAKRFNMFYSLCEQQLSKQRHYDFGLRSILSVLKASGEYKRKEHLEKEGLSKQFQDRDRMQQVYLVRSLRDQNLSKLVTDDLFIFQNLLFDLFPRSLSDFGKKNSFQKALSGKFRSKPELVQSKAFSLKIEQLNENCKVRHGIMVLGGSLTGKSTALNLLIQTINELGQEIQYRLLKINPKAITQKEMYGVKSQLSDDWIPGIFSVLWEKANNRNNRAINYWIVCDGPVDTLWIQNLNTVLDDNKILTLSNGQRIPMIESCRLLFQVQSLNNASPATVSRCGQVYFSTKDLQVQHIFEGWCELRQHQKGTLSQQIKLIKQYFARYITYEQIFNKLRNVLNLAPVIPVNDNFLMRSILNLANGLLTLPTENNRVVSQESYQNLVIFSIFWTVGILLEEEGRAKLIEWMLQNNYNQYLGNKVKSFFDCFLTFEDEFYLVKLEPKAWVPPKGRLKYTSIMLPTADTCKVTSVLNTILKQHRYHTNQLLDGVLLLGSSGTSKTSSVIMQEQLLLRTGKLFKRISLSSATQPHMIQEIIQEQCNFKVAKDYAPPNNKWMIVFLDDISQPQVNKWGDQITLELVRQLMQQKGFYSLQRSQRGNFKSIKFLQYIGAMQHPCSGRNDIPNRLKKMFYSINLTPPSALITIFQPLLQHQFQDCCGDQSIRMSKIVQKISQATISVWSNIRKTFLPTPSKFHYVFSLREISKVFWGVLQIDKQSVENCQPAIKLQHYMASLWKNQVEKVFIDRMTSVQQKQKAVQIICNALEGIFRFDTFVVKRLVSQRMAFIDFMQPDQKNEEGQVVSLGRRCYTGYEQFQTVKKRTQNMLKEYLDQIHLKKQGKRMDIVLFQEAIEQLISITRIIRTKRSNCLLVGIGGSGRSSLLKLSAFINRSTVKQCSQLMKQQSEKEVKETMKQLFNLSGHLNKDCVFMLTDQDIKRQQLLEYINMMLTTGQIARLFEKDEKEIIVINLRNDFVRERLEERTDRTERIHQFQISNLEIYKFFIERVNQNLHLALSFSPVGQKFRQKFRKFPSIFNECSILWFLPWSYSSLVEIASVKLRSFQISEKGQLIKAVSNIHLYINKLQAQYYAKTKKQNYSTPCIFIDLFKLLVRVFAKHNSAFDKDENNLNKGIQRINQASSKVQVMKKQLKLQEESLKKMTDHCERILQNLRVEQCKSQIIEKEVAKNTAQCQSKAKQITEQKDSARRDLNEAQPALVRAKEAVDGLKRADIDQIKKFGRIPPIVQYLIDSVGILFQGRLMPIQIQNQVQVTSTLNISYLKSSFEQFGKSVLYDPKFLDKLKTFQKQSLNGETIQLLQPYLKAQWSKEQIVSKVSNAAKGILKWILAIVQYYEKAQIVKPKRIRLREEENRLEIAMQNLQVSRAELHNIKEYINKLKQQSSKQLQTKQEIQYSLAKTKNNIRTAISLISSLRDEKSRWHQEASQIAGKKASLPGDSAIASVFVSYCGPFNLQFRNLIINKLVNEFKLSNVPFSSNVSKNLFKFLCEFLSDESRISDWMLQGLPKDDLSIQNAIIITNNEKHPLLLDPQSQGQRWIIKAQASIFDKNFTSSSLNHPKFKQVHLKHCVQNGKLLIIQEVQNQLQNLWSLMPLIERSFVMKKGKGRIKIGQFQFDYNPSFKLVLTSKLSFHNFQPQIFSNMCVVDFSVTQVGLEQQLLGIVITKEQKSLQDLLNQQLSDVNKNLKMLKQLDQKLLLKLSQSSTSLIEDKSLMDVLNKTKLQSREVKLQLFDSQQKTLEINQKREQYKPVAVRGAAIYFTIIDLPHISWMYNYSLQQFLQIFVQSTQLSQVNLTQSKRVQLICKLLTANTIKSISRGLLQIHKNTFLTTLSFRLLISMHKLTEEDIKFMLRDNSQIDLKNYINKPDPQKSTSWITDPIWNRLLKLSRYKFCEQFVVFQGLTDIILNNKFQWSKFYYKPDPQNNLPKLVADIIAAEKIEMQAFAKLCLIKAVREDRFQITSTEIIKAALGQQNLTLQNLNFQKIYLNSDWTVPILCLLTAGADPSSQIDQLSKKKKKFPVEKVSLGENQEQIARKAVRMCMQHGTWLVLQNCHLSLNFMQELNVFLSEVKNKQVHKFNCQARLFLTCQQNSSFPMGLLHKCVKVTNEVSKGIKNGVFRTLSTLVTQDFLQKVDSPSWRRIVLSLTLMHSVLIERKKYGATGWSNPYQFNNSDLQSSLFQVQKLLSSYISLQTMVLPLNVMKFMVEQIQYGGRITDNLDKEILHSYIQDYLRDQIAKHPQTEYTIKDVIIEAGVKQRLQFKVPSAAFSLQQHFESVLAKTKNDMPQLLGLHNSAQYTYRQDQSQRMLSLLTNIFQRNQSKVWSIQQISREQLVQLLSAVPAQFSVERVAEHIKKMSGPKALNASGLAVPSNVFLLQEVTQMQRLLSKLNSILQNAIKSIEGVVVLTPQIVQILHCVSIGKTPQQLLYDPSGQEISWMYYSFPIWMNDLRIRCEQLREWLKGARPQCVLIGAFFSPQSFLTSIKQQISRAHKQNQTRASVQSLWQLEDMVYEISLTQARDQQSIRQLKQTQGIYIRGLRLEGARLVKSQLEDPENRQYFYDLPVLNVTAKRKLNENKVTNLLSCPVYRYRSRTDSNLILRINLNCDNVNKWKLRGVCIVCTNQ